MRSRIETEIRGAGLLGQNASMEYRALVANQPLILTREPWNPWDANAIIAKTMLLQPCGYIAKEHAAVISPEMERGILWLCRVIEGGGPGRFARALLWKEDGRAEKYRRLAMASGANERVVDCVLQKKFMEDVQ